MRHLAQRHFRRSALVVLCGFLFVSAGPSAAQDDTEKRPQPPCSGPEFSQFHFWAGHWDVTQNGQPAGVNHIEIIDGGCAMLERWTSARGDFTGHSLNYYDPRSGTWKQHWVDSGGTILELEGGLREGPELGPGERIMVMVLEGEVPGPDGDFRRNRITWTPQPTDAVRQHWEVEGEDGWTTVFDGLYTRRTSSP